MSAQSIEMQAKIQEWRAKIAAGTLTAEEQAEIFTLLRKDRGAIAQATSGTKARKPKAAAPNGDDLLSQLEGM